MSIPTPLLLSIVAARQGIPFPTVIEAIALLFIFEILRETGTRMPSYIGQTLNIVGALVLGQAAVQAKFVSAPIVIIVALSGITGLIMPKMKGPIIILRLIYLLSASILGLYGFIFASIGTFIHLFEMRSFGVPYMYNFYSLEIEDVKDMAIRVPLWYMKLRPGALRIRNSIRMSGGVKKK
jgi:spore germination protein KA